MQSSKMFLQNNVKALSDIGIIPYEGMVIEGLPSLHLALHLSPQTDSLTSFNHNPNMDK